VYIVRVYLLIHAVDDIDSMFTGFTFKMKLLGSYIKDLFAHIIQNETMFDEK